VLLGLTGLVLLITCANLANLMLARATAREREIAVRLAIGASRWRIVRQMVAESLLIATLGAIGGGLLARWLSEGLVAFLSTDSNRIFMHLSPDWKVFAFLAGLAAAASVLFGLSPALKATATDPGKGMQAGGRSSTEGRRAFAMRRGLVVLQVALSLVLVVGAVLFGRSLRNLSSIDYGFRSEGIITTNIDLRRTAVTEAGRQQAFAAVMARIRAVPGVIGASETFIVPMSNSDWNGRIVVDGGLQEVPTHFNQVGGEYFATMETPLIAGRTFDWRDRIGSTAVAVVNETFAGHYYKGENPIGKRFSLEPSPGDPPPVYEVVGLVRDTKYLDVRERPRPIAYIATTQEARLPPWFDLLVRTDLPIASITPSLTRAVLEATPGAAVEYGTITSNVQDAIVSERLMATLSAFFGALAMLIATIGLYGVMSYMVTRRKVEIGVRMALGADPAKVVRMVLGESGALLAAGVAAGLVLAFAVSRYAATLLFGLEAWDPVSFALAAAALTLVSLLAAWIPARRASRLAPTIALRES
jgi:predicted permease